MTTSVLPSDTDRSQSADRRRWLKPAGLVLLAAVALLVPFQLAPFQVGRLTLVLVISIAVLGLNLLTGYSGQLSLGHGAFYAVGAYCVAILLREGLPLVVSILVAIALTFVLGFLFGIPALRLRGIYLALVTLALAVVVPPLIRRFSGLTGGVQGLLVDRPEPPAWSGLAPDQWLYLMTLAVAAIAFLVVRNLVTGRVGRALRSIKDNELVARSMGVNLALYKTTTFAISAGLAGLAGGMYTVVVGFVSPESFTFLLSINLVAAMVVGGTGTIAGALIGAAFIQYVPEWTSDIDAALGGILYGAALIAAVLLMPGGVMQALRRAGGLLQRGRA
jgi:branched-chain amino acid transport system permease protein